MVLFPFHVPIPIPRRLSDACLNLLSALRIIPSRRNRSERRKSASNRHGWIRLEFPLNFVTAPLVADLFLLAILAIGRQEVHDGTLGADHIEPIDILIFFLTLAYIAISIDASGLIRYLAFKVLQWGGKYGHRLFFYLYVFFFGIGSFIGNDPIILSGTAFLAYMTRVSSNIKHPKAWIHTQFAVANIASAILVSSNPTNLVLAGAFNIKFIHYTANMIVPVVVTAIVLFPFLLYIVFADEDLIPLSIDMHELPEEARRKKPVNPNIPHARPSEVEETAEGETELLSLEEIMNPFVDKGGAAFGAVIMAATLVTIIALNAASSGTHEHPVFWVTLPAAFVMFCWDVAFGWWNRHETRDIARNGRQEPDQTQSDLESPEDASTPEAFERKSQEATAVHQLAVLQSRSGDSSDKSNLADTDDEIRPESGRTQPVVTDTMAAGRMDVEKTISREACSSQNQAQRTLVSVIADAYRWLQETFPTATAVLTHLPYPLVPFAFSMFVLVQALVSKGWVAVFAHGWDHWVDKTGTVGSIGGMGFLSVILCNVSLYACITANLMTN